MKPNVVLFDTDARESRDFLEGLTAETRAEWRALYCRANRGRRHPLSNAARYIKYFVFPLGVFLLRRSYGTVVGWQAYYGLLFAFYCQVFRVRKVNRVLIKNFIYKPKKGAVGAVYARFMRYVATGAYADVFICASREHSARCADTFGGDPGRFVPLLFGVNDYARQLADRPPPTDDFILSLGRSNRDWPFLIDCLKETDLRAVIICDSQLTDGLPPNIRHLNRVWGKAAREYIRNCRMLILPILDGTVASGDTVLLMAMSFGKPVIVTRPSCLASDYVIDGETGLTVEKDKAAMLAAIRRLDTDEALRARLSRGARRQYEAEHSLYRYGKRIGRVLASRGYV
ncbi:MAG: glycosyltransferase family 4 protein [Clostridiales bacterium]|nr:glycosyltransferase family 4 protein [Clostridiales bacterium]